MKRLTGFEFNKEVADVFDDMLIRSVPFYMELQFVIAEIARKYYVPNTKIYDLGCSTGTTIKTIDELFGNKIGAHYVGLDASRHMLDKCKEKLAEKLERCVLVEQDLNELRRYEGFKDCSVALLVLTLQFVQPLNREKVLKKIFDSMNQNSALIVVEKVIYSDTTINQLFIEFYYEFKKRQGYSESEIYAKRESLENILVPLTEKENQQMLRRVGFREVESFFRWYNFCGILAIKS
jgi:tRNA (cmo5U34)-methyltransferase